MGCVVTKKSGHGLGPTRARVLRYVMSQHEPRSVADIAGALSLHSNTIRFHLEALMKLNYVSEKQDSPQGQGRPRRLYSATDQAPEVDTSHLRDLTQVLLRHIVGESDHPQKTVEEIGQAWGEELANIDNQDLQQLSEVATPDWLEEVTKHAESKGFQATDTGDQAVASTSCPYRTACQPLLPNACAIRLGLLRRCLEEEEAPLDIVDLAPG